MVDALGGGCQTPIGALRRGRRTTSSTIAAIVVALDGSRVVRGRRRAGRAADAAALGVAASRSSCSRDGAGEILADVQRAQGAVEGHAAMTTVRASSI